MQNKIIIFDLFDTLLKVNQSDFKSGLYLLWKNHFISACKFEVIATYSDEIFPEMKKRQRQHLEFSFADDFIPMACAHFGIKPFQIDIKEEAEIVSAISQCSVLPETMLLIQNLKKNNIPIYILSNSIFRSAALSAFIAQYGIGIYVERLFSSTDFGLRKPSTKLFDLCVNEIQKTYLDLEKEEILFVGNSYHCDVTGGYNAGIQTFWLNIHREDNIDGLPVRIINNLSEITIE